MNQTIKKLEEIVEREGVDYLHDEPYEVYLELTDENACPKDVAGGILLVLLSEILYNDEDIVDDISAFTRLIEKECGLNRSLSELVAVILASLYSEENRRRWSGENIGIEEFLDEEHDLEWNGTGSLYLDDSTIDCSYDAHYTIRPENPELIREQLSQVLKDDPFIDSYDLAYMFENIISEYLDTEFDDFLSDAEKKIENENELNEFLDEPFETICPPDRNYQFSVNDFKCLELLKEWCRENGFSVVSFEGKGSRDC